MNMNNSPTIEEFKALTSACNDDEAHHIQWIRSDGEVFIDPLPENLSPVGFEEEHDDLMIRYETCNCGNGYVGAEAATDDEYMNRIFNSMVKEWDLAKNSTGKHYIDNF